NASSTVSLNEGASDRSPVVPLPHFPPSSNKIQPLWPLGIGDRAQCPEEFLPPVHSSLVKLTEPREIPRPSLSRVPPGRSLFRLAGGEPPDLAGFLEPDRDAGEACSDCSLGFLRGVVGVHHERVAAPLVLPQADPFDPGLFQEPAFVFALERA